MAAFIKVCIVLIFEHAWRRLSLWSRCAFVRGPPKGFGIFTINGRLCFTDMAVGSLGEAVGGIRVISAHQDNRNKRFSGLVAFL